jgi:hypothetical protein
MAHACNPNTQEAVVGGLWVWGYTVSSRPAWPVWWEPVSEKLYNCKSSTVSVL